VKLWHAIVLSVALFLVAGLVFNAPYPWEKRCVQVASDVVNSYNGGCDDLSVPIENEEDFRESELRGT